MSGPSSSHCGPLAPERVKGPSYRIIAEFPAENEREAIRLLRMLGSHLIGQAYKLDLLIREMKIKGRSNEQSYSNIVRNRKFLHDLGFRVHANADRVQNFSRGFPIVAIGDHIFDSGACIDVQDIAAVMEKYLSVSPQGDIEGITKAATFVILALRRRIPDMPHQSSGVMPMSELPTDGRAVTVINRDGLTIDVRATPEARGYLIANFDAWREHGDPQ